MGAKSSDFNSSPFMPPALRGRFFFAVRDFGIPNFSTLAARAHFIYIQFYAASRCTCTFKFMLADAPERSKAALVTACEKIHKVFFDTLGGVHVRMPAQYVVVFIILTRHGWYPL